jgi:hypothetical protein
MGKSRISYLELDVMKPHSPSLPELLILIQNVMGVKKVQATLLEMDRYTENIKLIFNSNDIEYEKLRKCITDNNGIILSIDRVIVEKIISENACVKKHTN